MSEQEAALLHWRGVLDPHLAGETQFSNALENQSSKEIPFKVFLVFPECDYPLSAWETAFKELLDSYGFTVQIEKGVSIHTTRVIEDADLIILFPFCADTQAFCTEHAPTLSSKLILCISVDQRSMLYCQLATERHGVLTIDLAINGLQGSSKSRFGIDLVRHCADNLMNKIAASVRSLRIEKSVVVLIHGIRTRATWQTDIRDKLRKAGLIAVATNYNKLDAVKILLPFVKRRKAALQRVESEIKSILQTSEPEYVSLLAHSFGTYLVGELLAKPEYKFDRIALCGSLMPVDYDFDSARGRFTRIVNEVGCRDFWPVLAAQFSKAYGPTGSFGFNRGGSVEDRKHAQLGHTQFLQGEFCERYWVPFFCDGSIQDAEDTAAHPSRIVLFFDSSLFKFMVSGLLVAALVYFALLIFW